MRLRRALELLLVGALLASAVAGLATLGASTPARAGGRPTRTRRGFQGIHKIRHVIVIMQENRSFDSYFGTYPGADGIRAVCVRDPKDGSCDRPYHDSQDLNRGGPHSEANALADINGGRMNGFASQAEGARRGCVDLTNPWCRKHGRLDVMGYHDAREIPNYWAYAKNFVLQDHMFEPNASWSLPAHLFIVSEWSARCTNASPSSCSNQDQRPGLPPDFGHNRVDAKPPKYSWTDLTYLLHEHHVSWRYYVFKGTEPDCESGRTACGDVLQDPQTPGIWNPLPFFETVKQDHQLGNVTSLGRYFEAARRGTLPAVSWIVPNGRVSEHPPGLVSAGEKYVTRLVDAAMRQLRGEGHVHQRAAVCAASFCACDLGLDWRSGRDVWMAELLGADEALCDGNWQRIAGIGSDQAAYPRIYNPLKQARRFDPGAAYVRRWIPELAAFPDAAILDPLGARRAQLQLALFGDRGYPEPVLEHEPVARAFLQRYTREVGSSPLAS